MNIITVVPPPFEPVSVAEVYEHMRWDIEETEGSPPMPVYPLLRTVEIAIAAARRQVEQITHLSLVEQTLRINYSSLPADYWGFWGWMTFAGRQGRGIELLKPPVLAVESVGYFNEQNVLTTIDPANYFITEDVVPQVRFVSDFSMPACSVYRRPDAAQVVYRAGYAPEGSPPATQEQYAANVPHGLKQAILLGAQLLLDRFDANERADLTRAQEALLSPYIIYTFPA